MGHQMLPGPGGRTRVGAEAFRGGAVHFLRALFLLLPIVVPPQLHGGLDDDDEEDEEEDEEDDEDDEEDEEDEEEDEEDEEDEEVEALAAAEVAAARSRAEALPDLVQEFQAIADECDLRTPTSSPDPGLSVAATIGSMHSIRIGRPDSPPQAQQQDQQEAPQEPAAEPAAVQVRDPTTWTILQHDGPNNLGLWCNAAPCASNGSNRLGLCATGGEQRPAGRGEGRRPHDRAAHRDTCRR